MSESIVGRDYGPEEPRERIAVLGAADAQIRRTLAALESTIPVRFVHLGRSDPRSLAGVLALDEQDVPPGLSHLPRLTLGRAVPFEQAGRAAAQAQSQVLIGDRPELSRPLRGRAIEEALPAGQLPRAPVEADRVLASVAGSPVWAVGSTRTGAPTAWRSSYPLAGLAPSQTLRSNFKAGRFMGLLPTLHFLEAVLGEQAWRQPPPRAAFVVDDPNLHWSSYGFLDYKQLAAHARLHGYHLALGTVPLDGWHVHRRTAALIKQNAGSLSLTIHGNDHVSRELAQLVDDEHAVAAIAQALRRIRCQEQRSRVRVDRVMVPPHSACSHAALMAMFRLGLDAVCVNRPYPWRDEMPDPTPLTGWHPAELVAGGIAVLLRNRLDESRGDLVFRTLLGQPLVLYGHHGDFAEGLDVLAQATRDVQAIAGASWGPLGWIARESCATRRLGETMLVRMYARRTTVKVPEGVRLLQIQFPEPDGGPGWHRLVHPDGVANVEFDRGWGVSEPLPCRQQTTIELALLPDRPLSPTAVPAPRLRAWPLVRRLGTETRDRALPALHGARRSKAPATPDRSVHDGSTADIGQR